MVVKFPLRQKNIVYGLIKSPAFIVFLLSSSLFLINLVLTYKLRPFNSDDVFWQLILLHWSPFSGSTATLGNSSVYVDKIPFFEIIGHFLQPSRKALFIEASLSALAGFSGFYFASLYFLKKAKIQLSYSNLLPFIWITSFGYSFMQLFLNPNWRGFQLGFSFVVFALVAAFFYGDIKLEKWWSKLVFLLLAIYAGLQAYSDPYFIYFTVVPIIMLSVCLFVIKKINKKQVVFITVAVAITLLSSKLFGWLSYAAGIRTTIDYPMEFIDFENLANAFSGSIHGILIIFNSDFFGLPLKEISTLVPILNFAILCTLIYALFKSLSLLRQQKIKLLTFDHTWQLFFVGLCALIFLSHTVSTQGQGVATYRYFLLFVFASVLAYALFISKAHNGPVKSSLVILMIIAILSNLLLNLTAIQSKTSSEVATNQANSLNDTIIEALKDRGYTKGYSNYWDADINSYLSAGSINFLPILCTGKSIQTWHWLINDDAFSQKADRSFFLVDPSLPAAACKQSDIIRARGNPQSTIHIANKTLLLYDYDPGLK